MSLGQKYFDPQEGLADHPVFDDFQHFINQLQEMPGQCSADLTADDICHFSSDRKQLSMSLKQPFGKGRMELLQLPSGFSIGRSDYFLNYPLQSHYRYLSDQLGFGLMLSGSFGLAVPELHLSDQVEAGEIWVRKGQAEDICATQFSGKRVCGVSLDLSAQMLEVWREEAPCRLKKSLGRHSTAPDCFRYGVVTADIRKLAMKMLACPTTDLCSRLEYESLGLSLLALLLNPDEKGSGMTATEKRHARQKHLISQVIEILHEEWFDPPTIHGLATRVGMNECYLKSGFKEVTGLTIGRYVRGLRMEQARLLLATQGYTVHQAALEVGFSNQSHFSSAFSEHFGYRPSQISRQVMVSFS
ncbi:helix-turn-helix transcriptional regulator [Oceanospirillum maris]|uniref:helix-turn-helix transcriptional regulator n=1 Tax=Oceanospirillum maris TaxID=64977 RepID=UPI00041E7343|nr:AraC family transcriptional regulator [Oceanospirillum maris]